MEETAFDCKLEATDFVKIANKLIIYLDDGSVVSCTDRGINDNVDDVATSAYRLTSSEVVHEKEQHKYHSLRNCLSYMRPFNLWRGYTQHQTKALRKQISPKLLSVFLKSKLTTIKPIPMKKKGVIVSGYFNPIHKGHLEYFNNAKALQTLFVIVKMIISEH